MHGIWNWRSIYKSLLIIVEISFHWRSVCVQYTQVAYVAHSHFVVTNFWRLIFNDHEKWREEEEEQERPNDQKHAVQKNYQNY